MNALVCLRVRCAMARVARCASRAGRLAVVGVLAGWAAGTSPAAHAVNISASSSGYGLFTDVTAAAVVNLGVGPLPAGVAGTAPAPYSPSSTVLNVSSTTSVPFVANATVTAGAVTASATSNVDGLPGSRTTLATGGIVGGNIDSITLPVIGDGITLLGIDATLSSSAQVSGDFGSLAAMGVTTIQDLGLIITAIPVDLSAYVNAAVAPNTSVNLAALGIANATLILNEQIIAGDQSSIVVNAFHLNVNILGVLTTQVILGHSQAQMSAIAVPEPATAGLALAGLIGLVVVGRRRGARG